MLCCRLLHHLSSAKPLIDILEQSCVIKKTSVATNIVLLTHLLKSLLENGCYPPIVSGTNVHEHVTTTTAYT